MSLSQMVLPPELPHITMEADEFERMMIDFHRRCHQLVEGWNHADAKAAGVYPADVRQLRLGAFPSRQKLQKIAAHAGQDASEWEESRRKLACHMGAVGFGGLRDLAWMLRNWAYHNQATPPIPGVITSTYHRALNGTRLVSKKVLRAIIAGTGGNEAECAIWENYHLQAKERSPEDTPYNIGLQLRKLRAGRPQRTIIQYGLSENMVSSVDAGHCLPAFETTIIYAHACGADVSEWVDRWHTARDRESRLKGAFGEAALMGDILRRLLLGARISDNGLQIDAISPRELAKERGVDYETLSNTVNGKPVSTSEYRQELLAYLKSKVE